MSSRGSSDGRHGQICEGGAGGIGKRTVHAAGGSIHSADPPRREGRCGQFRRSGKGGGVMMPDISFANKYFFLLLVLIPLLAGVYIFFNRKRQTNLTFSSFDNFKGYVPTFRQ